MAIGDEKFQTITFRARLGASGGLVYTVEFSEDLISWSSAPKDVIEVGRLNPYDGTGTEIVTYRAQVTIPQGEAQNVRLVDTGDFDADDYFLWGLELAGSYGPFYAQGEYIQTKVDRADGGNDDPTFNGWYVQGSWFITGESRRYSSSSGAWSSTARMAPTLVWCCTQAFIDRSYMRTGARRDGRR